MKKEGLNFRIDYFLNIFFVFVIFVIFTGFIYIFITDEKINRKNFYNEIQDVGIVNENVTIDSSDGEKIKRDLPAKLEGDKVYYVNFTPQKSKREEPLYVSISSSYLSFSLRYGDEIIYEYLADESSSIKSMASSFKYFRIPDKYVGKELCVEFTSNINDVYGIMIPPILFGSKVAINKYLLSESVWSINTFLLFFIVGVIIFVSYIVSCILKFNNIKYLIASIFLFNIAMSCIFASWIMYFYFGENILIYYLESSFINISFIPVLLLLINEFKTNDYIDWRYESLKLMLVIVILNALIQVILTILSISEFIIMRPITQVICFLFFIAILFIIFTMDSNMMKEKRKIILAYTPLSIAFIITSIHYFIHFTLSFNTWFILAIIFFLGVQFFVDVKNYAKKHLDTMENKFYKELAYIDSLSQLANRHAFDRDMKEIRNREVFYKNILFIMVDLNGLKEINDRHGHKVGDMYIKAAADVLKEITNSFSKTYAYRYAGDEYFLISYDKDNKKIREIIKSIDDEIAKYRLEGVKEPLSLAIGYEFTEIDDKFDLGHIMRSVDEKMYRDKQVKKEACYVRK